MLDIQRLHMTWVLGCENLAMILCRDSRALFSVQDL
ncbi:hypothetical protein Clow_01653 [Corynebacterium lowii]|uniref:Uncharacterized protein n=1 Tax=Corynebacterium lowii TaxID=1544413 RepID=A0A0Q1E0B1_9CORY|nr:hypothetical protein Clow_01653 [Corynebacterium lowii]MDP9850660.1 hypothetical protein [Corynebacterium lowii]